MQLRFKSKPERSWISRTFLIKTTLLILIFLFAVFLLDKINMPTPTKLIKQEVSNDKLITLK
tara:strand:- start:172 stop:357 length:186 start_codon:yes stop_codon:yes gene_type:complete